MTIDRLEAAREEIAVVQYAAQHGDACDAVGRLADVVSDVIRETKTMVPRRQHTPRKEPMTDTSTLHCFLFDDQAEHLKAILTGRESFEPDACWLCDELAHAVGVELGSTPSPAEGTKGERRGE